MRILHLSDFHYKKHKAHVFQKQVDRLLTSLKDVCPKADAIFFTGDLVNAGGEDFQAAESMLLKPLLSQVDVSKDCLFLCQGNHDINRQSESKVVNKFFESVESIEALDEYFEANDSDFRLSLQPSANYFEFIQSFYSSGENVVQPLFTTHKRTIAGKRVGVASFNSAWRSKNDNDKNNLYLPPAAVDLAIAQLGGCDFKIALMHHPFSWLKNFNVDSIEDIICGNFNMLLTGHVHLDRNAASYVRNNGIFAHTARASLAKPGDGEIGYSVIEIDLDNPCKARVEELLWNESLASFIAPDPIVFTMPMSEMKEKQNDLRQKLKAKSEIVLASANELLVEYDPTDKNAFLRNYKNPSLKLSSEAELGKTAIATGPSPDELLNFQKNYLVFGKSKYGKTSLLRRIQLHQLLNFRDLNVVPVYIDFKQHPSGVKDLIRLLMHEIGISNADTEELLTEGRIRLLIDNFSSGHILHQPLQDLLSKFQNTKFIACTEWTASYYIEAQKLDRGATSLYFHDLKTQEIRKYTNGLVTEETNAIEEIIDRILAVCKQMHFPMSYWTVGLLLHIHKHSRDFAEKDLSNLLDLYVEETLDRKGLQAGTLHCDYDDLKSLCTNLAVWLYENHAAQGYSATSTEIIDFIQSLKDKKIRFVAQPYEVFAYLEKVGVFSEKANAWTFRLNGVFEYFLAQGIASSDEFKTAILNDSNAYINFGNEIEIFSGQQKQNAELLRAIFDITKKAIDPFTNTYPSISLDELLISKAGLDFNLKERVSALGGKIISEEERDNAIESTVPARIETEVKVKDESISKMDEFNVRERYLSIFARVFRNINDVDTQLATECFEYIIRNYCLLGFRILDEAEARHADSNSTERDEAGEILSLLSAVVPLLMQVALHDSVGHYNLEELINRRIIKLSENGESRQNQYELFMLHLLLTDINPNRHRDSIDALIELLSISILRSSLLIKIFYYLTFRATKNKDLESFLRSRMEKLKKKVDSSYKTGGLTNVIENQKRLRLK